MSNYNKRQALLDLTRPHAATLDEANANTAALAELLLDHLKQHDSEDEAPESHQHEWDFDTFVDNLNLTEQQVAQLVEFANGKLINSQGETFHLMTNPVAAALASILRGNSVA